MLEKVSLLVKEIESCIGYHLSLHTFEFIMHTNNLLKTGSELMLTV